VDVRFALAEASQFDPSDPMRPVTELQAVLNADPSHVGANFLLGERRFLIGRIDSARVSLQRVLALAPEGDPIRARAQEVLAAIDAAQQAQAGASP
jgi:cytochrome c-type biogenesis protein CcmH/NrfG